jgi:acylphosphatase
MSDNQQRLHAIVQGHVQGVSFRFYTVEAAMRLQITGWVRNLPDGNVEVTAEAPQKELDKLLTFLRRGPSGARVTQVDVVWQDATGQFEDFRIVY